MTDAAAMRLLALEAQNRALHARIAELEKALSFYTDKFNLEIEPEYDGDYDAPILYHVYERTEGTEPALYGTRALNALCLEGFKKLESE